MKIALVTNKAPHHKYWTYSLYRKFNVVAILHPNLSQNNRSRKYFRYGYFYLTLNLLSRIYQRFSDDSYRNQLHKYEREFFGVYDEKYKQIPNNLVYDISSVNKKETIELVKRLEVDIICFLGGEIAKKEFIASANVASLNFHSGISPFYNGNSTIPFAVADFRPNFVGGTLMYITDKIDSGPIISHYITPIKKNDSAASLFLTTIKGAVKLYTDALDQFEAGLLPSGIKQASSFKYTRAIDWTIVQDLRLRHFEKKNIIERYLRSEEIIKYYEMENIDELKLYSHLLRFLLKN